jgi:hypothetical protein
MTKERSTLSKRPDPNSIARRSSSRITVQIGKGMGVPLYANQEAEEFALGIGGTILRAFKLDETAQNLIRLYERGGYVDVLNEVTRLDAVPELVLALLLQRRKERTKIASKNAKSKVQKNGLEQLKMEATRNYLSARDKQNKDDFAHEFSQRLEARKNEALRSLHEAKTLLEVEALRRAGGGAQLRKKQENTQKLNDLTNKVRTAELQACFKVYAPSTIRDVWLKGI